MHVTRQHLEWVIKEWRKVLSTDKCKVKLSNADRCEEETGSAFSMFAFINLTGLMVAELRFGVESVFKARTIKFF